jgi:hypothetical protein
LPVDIFTEAEVTVLENKFKESSDIIEAETQCINVILVYLCSFKVALIPLSTGMFE